MAKRSMNEKLKNLKAEKENIPAVEKLKVSEEPEVPGTNVKISEVRNVAEEDAEAERPVPVPKKNRRGGKQVQAELAAAKELAEGNKEKYTRLMAEFDNMRSRNERESAEMGDKGAMEAIGKILPIIDNLERAIDTVEEDQKNAFEEGIEKIYKQLMDTLEELGVKPMDAVDKEFDPDFHNAVIHIEDENVGENTIVEEMQKGYMFKDKVLRHAMVKVAN